MLLEHLSLFIGQSLSGSDSNGLGQAALREADEIRTSLAGWEPAWGRS